LVLRGFESPGAVDPEAPILVLLLRAPPRLPSAPPRSLVPTPTSASETYGGPLFFPASRYARPDCLPATPLHAFVIRKSIAPSPSTSPMPVVSKPKVSFATVHTHDSRSAPSL